MSRQLRPITVIQPLTKVAEIRVGYLFVNVIGAALGFASLGIVYILDDAGLLPEPTLFDIVGLVVGLLVSTVLHELAHALAAITVGGLRWQDLELGCKWKALVAYCLCLKPMTVRAYRWYAAFPLLILVPLAGLLFWLWPAFWSVLLVLIVAVGTVGDLIMLFKVRGYSGSLQFVEHPAAIGGDIYQQT